MFRVGTANVAGFNNKLSLAASLPHGVWGYTETHLTSDQMPMARGVIRRHGRDAQRNLGCVFGAPAPPRSVNSSAGTWTGVCNVADFPPVPVPLCSTGIDFDRSRLLVATHFIGQLSLTCATLYGAAQSPTFRDPLQITHELVQAARQAVVENCRGPRCIMGDFNASLMEFPEMYQWRLRGWQGVQIAALERWGLLPAYL